MFTTKGLKDSANIENLFIMGDNDLDSLWTPWLDENEFVQLVKKVYLLQKQDKIDFEPLNSWNIKEYTDPPSWTQVIF